MSTYSAYGVAGYGDADTSPPPSLTFRVADSLTGRLIGRLNPSEWSFDDPLTGVAKGGLTLPLPTDPIDVARLVELSRPHACQVGAQDDQGRWWFGGPIIAEPAVADRQVKITFADWRAWFYAAALDTDYIQAGVEQMLAMSDVAEIVLGDVGAPHLTTDSAAVSGVLRDVTFRNAMMAGAAFDDVARRVNGPDWWTYLATDPVDPTVVVAHLAFAYPERATDYGLYFRYRLGSGGNLLTYTWPEGNLPATRVIATQGNPPDQLVVVAEDPAVTSGDALRWDELYALPDGVTDATRAFEYALARLVSRGRESGTVTADVDPAATDLGAWGPGDRVRLSVQDGWRDIEKSSVRVIGRTLAGRASSVTSVKVSLALGEPEADIDSPDLVVI